MIRDHGMMIRDHGVMIRDLVPRAHVSSAWRVSLCCWISRNCSSRTGNAPLKCSLTSFAFCTCLRGLGPQSLHQPVYGDRRNLTTFHTDSCGVRMTGVKLGRSSGDVTSVVSGALNDIYADLPFTVRFWQAVTENICSGAGSPADRGYSSWVVRPWRISFSRFVKTICEFRNIFYLSSSV